MRTFFYLSFATLLNVGVAAYAQEAQTETIRLTIQNEWKKEKLNTPVEWKLNETQQRADYQSVLVKSEGAEIPAQLDDLDGDGLADEVAFLLDMPGKSKKEVMLVLSTEKSTVSYPAQVYAEMLLSDKKAGHKPIQGLSVPGEVNVYNNLHHHGPAFESELVAYRLYFDQRQTVDIYGKRRKALELSETQFYPTKEQLAANFGDDILWAGTTCALGTFRGYVKENPSYIEPVVLRTECIRAYGPLRTVVEIKDQQWQYQGQMLDLTLRYILYGGHRDVRVEVNVVANEPISNPFCTGVIKLENAELFTDHRGLAGCWGSNWPAGKTDTIGRSRETLGLAVNIPTRYIQGEPENAENLLYLLGDRARMLSKEFSMSYGIAFASDKETFGLHQANDWFKWMKAWKEDSLHELTIKEHN